MAITTHGGTTDASDKPTSEATFAASDGSARLASTLLEIASKCHALAAELALTMEMTKARYWQEKAEHAEALAAKLTKEEAPNDQALRPARSNEKDSQ